MGQSVGSRVWGYLGFGSSPPRRSASRRVDSDRVPLLKRAAGDRHRADPLSPSKPNAQISAGPSRGKELARPTDSKHFPEFARSATVYDSSSDLYFDASKVSPEIFKDVCQGAPIAAMHAVAKPLRSCGKTMYAQIRNHADRPWEHRWLESGEILDEATDVEKAQARVVLAPYVGGDERGHVSAGDLDRAVSLLFASVNSNGDAIWVDFQQFNEGLGKDRSLPDPQLQDLVAALSTCLQSFVDRRKAQSWDKVYILYPVDAKLRIQ